MTKTEHYNLNQWEPGDAVNREDFNSDNAAIDAALGELSTAVESKAEQAELDATNAALGQVAAALGSGGKNCRIQYGTYVGTGTHGESNPTRLEFDFYPLWLFVAAEQDLVDGRTIYLRPLPNTMTATGGSLLVTWEERAVSWYVTSTINPHIGQNNTAGYTYRWVAIGYAP